MVAGCIIKTFYLSFYLTNNVCKLVIKYKEFAGIFKSESNLL